jgi:hypothetical protein
MATSAGHTVNVLETRARLVVDRPALADLTGVVMPTNCRCILAKGRGLRAKGRKIERVRRLALGPQPLADEVTCAERIQLTNPHLCRIPRAGLGAISVEASP